jgi:galactose-6-phosphate isomerase
MPFLDVSDILSDPDFADIALTVTRNAQTVGSNGRAVVSPRSERFSGVVTQADGKTFDRFPEAARVSGSITITTTFCLRIVGADIDADIVTDAYGQRFTVTAIADYSRYGAGFVVALCEPLGVA